MKLRIVKRRRAAHYNPLLDTVNRNHDRKRIKLKIRVPKIVRDFLLLVIFLVYLIESMHIAYLHSSFDMNKVLNSLSAWWTL